MKKIVEYLQKKSLLFKSFKEFKPKDLGSRKKINLYLGVDLKGYYTAVFYVEKKTRVLQKETEDYMLLHEKLEKYIDSSIKKKYLLMKTPLCSKAKRKLEMQSWKVWEV